MKRVFATWLVIITAAALAVVMPARSQSPLSMQRYGVGKVVAAGGGCTEATNWITRALAADAAYDATHQADDTTFICGLVTDGLWSGVDVIKVYATQSSAVALLNMKSASFASSLVNSPSFTADRGYKSDGSTSYINSNFNPTSAAGACGINSCAISSAQITSRTADNNGSLIGVVTATTGYSYIVPKQATAQFSVDVNGNTFVGPISNVTNAQGIFFASRTSSSAVASYQNATPISSSGADTATALPNLNFFEAAFNNNGTPSQFTVNTDVVAYSMVGVGLSSGNVTLFNTRVFNLLHARSAL